MSATFTIRGTNLPPIRCDLYRMGEEVWAATDKATFIMPGPGVASETNLLSPHATIPEKAVHPEDQDFTDWYAEAHAIDATNGTAVVVKADVENETAIVLDKLPLDFASYMLVKNLWADLPLVWMLHGNRIFARHEGKLVAEISFAEHWVALEVTPVDLGGGELWLANEHFCLAPPPGQEVVPSEHLHLVPREGPVVDGIRALLAKPIPPEVKVTEAGPKVQVGPAQVPERAFHVVCRALRREVTWHASSHMAMVVAVAEGKPVAFMMPVVPMMGKVGSA